ncbi:MAG: hypothetical protein H0V66_06955 [Bdellovibrionales bacterium]|nr:hypothetical protein [Bdellovibrionales bacterium]
MKKTVLFLAMLLMMNQGFSQEVKVVTQAEKDAVAEDLEKEAQSDKHDAKTKRIFKKVAKSIKESSQEMVIEVKKLDKCDNCEDKPKEEIIVRNVGRKLGKASAWLTTTTSKPFMNASGFLTGLFEKKDKNKDIVALYQFFINHSKEFDLLYQEAGSPEEMVEVMLAKMEEIVEKKSHIILKDFLVSLGITREIPADLSDFELTEEEIAAIDLTKVTPDFINNHAEYQEVKPIIGEVTQQELQDIIMSGYFDKSIGFENYKAALPKIHEGAITIVGQIFGPKIVLGVISKSLAGLYAVPVIIADIGTGVSVAICMQKTTQEKFEDDKDLRSFCSYVVNRSAYQLMKSRAKGYVAGKNTREKIEKKLKALKERRAARKAKKALENEHNEMTLQLPVH